MQAWTNSLALRACICVILSIVPSVSLAQKNFDIVVKDRALVQRCVTGNNARDIAVGIPGGFNFAFDPVKCRLSHVWFGGFLDFEAEATGRGGRKVNLLGAKQQVGTGELPIRIGDANKDPGEIKFEGYRKEPATGIPTFLFQVDGVSIEQRVLSFGLDQVAIELSFPESGEAPRFYRMNQAEVKSVEVSEKLTVDESGIIKIPAKESWAQIKLTLKPCKEKFVRPEPTTNGRLLYAMHCMSCHTLNGTKKIGPSFSELWTAKRKISRGDKTESIDADETYIRESILKPQAAIVQGYENANKMVDIRDTLSEKQIDALVNFLMELKYSSSDTKNQSPTDFRYGSVDDKEQIVSTSGMRNISGVFPHLTTYAQSRRDGKFFKEHHQECGIGAVVPWAGKLWMITYAPHQPRGSDHKLYSIDKDMTMTVHPESVGGTPAGRMIHEESKQLFIGHYAIDQSGKIRVISPKKMPARVTALMRHLKDPENFAYLYDMENMFYEVNVHTLEFKRLFEDPIPGYHGKGGFTSQGKVVVSNNGETNSKLDRNKHWQVPQATKGPEDRGCLATWDGEKWEIAERRQYTEVTGPEGIRPTSAGSNDPVWSIGWDKRSLRLKVMEDGKFSTFLLPKGCLNNDASHGWFTEWPRIRDVGQEKLLMDMHGLFFAFPKDFSRNNSGGIEPIASHLRYVPDFCQWNNKLVLATDESSVQGNPLTGQPQSNLWIGKHEELKDWGPRSAMGSIYMNDPIKASVPSSPFLINGFPRKIIHLSADQPVAFDLQIDRKGNGTWEDYKRIEVDQYASHIFPEEFESQWIRVQADRDCRASVSFHYGDDTWRDRSEGAELFSALANVNEENANGCLLYPKKNNRNLHIIQSETHQEFDAVDFTFKPTDKDKSLEKLLSVHPEFSVDEASVILESKEDRSVVGKKGRGIQLRLPKGDPAFDEPLSFGHPRMHRELESERLMANIHGTFYEVPFWIVGQPPLYSRMRPVASHEKQISDFTTWNGLLVMSGLKADAPASEHVYKSNKGHASLWFGGIDDLWKLGKPVGVGGPWKKTTVKADVPSDPYLMTGYDKKTLELTADRDCTITLEIDFDHWTGFHRCQDFQVKAGEKLTHNFPKEFSAHWVRVVSDKDVTATAWFIYE